MSTRAATHGDDAFHSLRDGFTSMLQADDVEKHVPTVAMHPIEHGSRSAKGGDDERHALLDANVEIVFEARVGLVHDDVNGERRNRPIGMRMLEPSQLLTNADQGGPKVFRRSHR